MTDALQQPKRLAGGAYGQYVATNRAEFAKECKGKPAVEVVKLASAKWKTLTETDKEKYVKIYKEKHAQFEIEMKAFLDAGGVKQTNKRSADNEGRGKGKKKRKVKDPNRPKQPAGGAFGQFLAKHRPEYMKQCAGQPITAVTKLASEKWKSVTPAEKKECEGLYQKKKEEFQEAMKTYVPPTVAEEEDGGDEDEEEEDEDEDEDEEEEEAEEKKEQPKGKAKAKASSAMKAPPKKK